MSNIGIMQGRLSPPRGDLIQWYPEDTWESEFYLAKEIGLVCIEWVFQKSSANENLISYDSGINKIPFNDNLPSILKWICCKKFW